MNVRIYILAFHFVVVVKAQHTTKGYTVANWARRMIGKREKKEERKRGAARQGNKKPRAIEEKSRTRVRKLCRSEIDKKT